MIINHTGRIFKLRELDGFHNIQKILYELEIPFNIVIELVEIKEKFDDNFRDFFYFCHENNHYLIKKHLGLGLVGHITRLIEEDGYLMYIFSNKNH